MELFIILALAGAVFGGACAILASNKNRDVFGWFVLGFLFNLVALIVIAAISVLDKREAGDDQDTRKDTAADDLNREDLRKKAAELSAALKQSREKLS